VLALLVGTLCVLIGTAITVTPQTPSPAGQSPAGQPSPAGPPPAGQQPPEGARAGGGRGNATAALFATTCAPCHGTDLAGGRAASLFSERFLASNDDETLIAKITNGVPNTAMMPFKGTLDDQQIWQIVASMGQQNGITERSHEGMEQPIVYYTPTIAPSGISFYSGSKYPGWKNNLFVAALAGQQLRRLEISGRKVIHQEPVFEQFGRVRAVTTGPDGLLYVLLQNPTGAGTGLGLSSSTPGMVIRLVPAAQK
jgi:mono/diheme cytochrome c family protein